MIDVRSRLTNGHQTREREDLAPYLKDIQVLQNRFTLTDRMANQSAALLSRWGVRARGPEYVAPHALFVLKFADSAKRSENITQGLIDIGVFSSSGALLLRKADPHRAVEFLQRHSFADGQGLTALEAQGVRIYLLGLEENLQLLGQDIMQLPISFRRDWFYYAGLTQNTEFSRVWANKLRYHHILSLDYAPQDGGATYQAFSDELLRDVRRFGVHQGWPQEREQRALLRATREALFPLPQFTPGAAPPGYEP